MKKKILVLSLGVASMMPVAAKSNDPIVMTVGNEKVPLSEFEYLYNKNNGQQMTPMTVDEYVDLFSVYKMKALEAKAEGMDTVAAFKAEYAKYRDELAEPYLRDTQEEQRLIDEAFSHLSHEVRVRHVMLDKGRTPEDGKLAVAKLDSIRTEILNGADFADMARRYSIDRTARSNGGLMNWIAPGRYPYSFEKAAYDDSIGEISPVIETPFGYHIVRLEEMRPARGEALVRHILLMTRNMDDEQKQVVKQRIDSIYDALIAGADFAQMAVAMSQDPGTAPDGGMLPWFSTGVMVPEFEDVAFSLEDGAISKPFPTSYGYHIINKLDSRGVPSREQARDKILNTMKRDGRYDQPHLKRMADLRKKFGARLYDNNVESLKASINDHGSLDSSLVATFINYPVVLGEVNGNVFSTINLLADFEGKPMAPEEAKQFVDEKLQSIIDDITIDAEVAEIAKTDTDFRNLLTEYHDGLLLFDIAKENVWDKASFDKEGQEAYFLSHRDSYTFDAPKYKGFIVYSVNDSIAGLVNDYLATKPAVDSLTSHLKANLGHMARVERVLAGKGENKVVDYLVFDGPDPELKGVWKRAVVYGGRMIEAPEEVADVKGKVIADYQSSLEKSWTEKLKSKYPVKVNKKVLKKLHSPKN